MTSSIIGIDTNKERIEIPKPARLQGTLILGRSGKGKSGLVENLLKQEIDQEIGVCLIEPHGSSIQNVLSLVPSKREKDIILLNPLDYDFPFGLNLYECPNPKDPVQVQRANEQVMHIFELLWGTGEAHSLGPVIAQGLRNSAYVLIQNPGMTMAEVSDLFLNEKMCKRLLATLPDTLANQKVRQYWERYWDASPHIKDEMASPTLNKVDEFLTNPILSHIVGQGKTTINFREIMDSKPGKIVLVQLDTENQNVTKLVGSAIVAQILYAAYSRRDIPEEKRKQFHVYADEFQYFASPDFGRIITELRKFGIAVTISHQYRDQLEYKLRKATIAVENLIVFNVTSDDAEEMAQAFQLDPKRELVWQPKRVEQFTLEEVSYWTDLEQSERYFQLCEKIEEQKQALLPVSSVLEEVFHIYAEYMLPSRVKDDFESSDFNPPLHGLNPMSPGVQEVILEEPGRFFKINLPSRWERSLQRKIKEYGEGEKKKYASYLLENIQALLQEEDKNNPLFEFRPPRYTRKEIENLASEKKEMLSKECKDNIKKKKLQTLGLILLGIPILVFFTYIFGVEGFILSLIFVIPLTCAFIKRWKDFPDMRDFSPEKFWFFKRYRNKEHRYVDSEWIYMADTIAEWEGRNSEEGWIGARHDILNGGESVTSYDGFWRLHEFPLATEWLQNEVQRGMMFAQGLQKEIEKNEKEAAYIKATYYKTEIKRVSQGYFLETSNSETHTQRVGGRFYSEGDSRSVHYKEWVLEPGPPEPLANTEKRIKDDIIRLPDFTAKARIKVATDDKDENGKTIYIIGEYTIKTIKPEKGISGELLQERIRRIQAQNKSAGYCRSRIEVEKEIQKRQPLKTAPKVPLQPLQEAEKVPSAPKRSRRQQNDTL